MGNEITQSFRAVATAALAVSAAAGPVGATVAQLGRIAGSERKRRWLIDSAELDAVIDCSHEDVRDEMQETLVPEIHSGRLAYREDVSIGLDSPLKPSAASSAARISEKRWLRWSASKCLHPKQC